MGLGLLALLLMALLTLWRAFAAVAVWDWYVSDYIVFDPTIDLLFGVVLFLHILTYVYQQKKGEPELSPSILLEVALNQFLLIAIALFIAWAGKVFLVLID